jgi:hypothetical protein
MLTEVGTEEYERQAGVNDSRSSTRPVTLLMREMNACLVNDECNSCLLK